MSAKKCASSMKAGAYRRNPSRIQEKSGRRMGEVWRALCGAWREWLAKARI
ncbi:hypothetical protein [Helicobacter sp. CLO-3]|uniref:hypothetical protein n=1 Tax=Helicobacter sp. CLO-3 TaxID=211 RepID=UPI0012E7CF5E|nr:hypothetical protein [Helicobacter sp. CLO-3]